MKLKLFEVILTVVFLVLIGSMTVGTWYYNKMKSFTCRATLEQHNKDVVMNLSLRFMFKGSYGTVALNGEMVAGDSRSIKMSREIYFTYKQDGTFYPLTSKRMTKYPDDSMTEEWMSRYLPGFYINSGHELYLMINRYNDGKYLFFIDSIPLLTCQSN